MGYSSEWGKFAAQGGPFPAGKKNPRPQDYKGKYTFSGLPEMGSQPFRKELPPARDDNRDPTLLDGTYSNSGGPSFDNILKKWREGRGAGQGLAVWPALCGDQRYADTGACCQTRLPP